MVTLKLTLPSVAPLKAASALRIGASSPFWPTMRGVADDGYTGGTPPGAYSPFISWCWARRFTDGAVGESVHGAVVPESSG